MLDLRANTQVIVTVGSFVDEGDGKTPETGITLGAADQAELIKHGATSVVDISGATWAAVTGMDGYYSLTLTTSHTDTEGQLTVVVQDASVCLPVRNAFRVLSEAAYDSLYAAKDDGFMDVNIKTVGRADTQETEADNLEAACAAYSATRGLSGTALPAVAAGGAGGVPTDSAGKTSFNDLSAAQVNAECDTALSDYDAPTKAEMDTAFTEIKGATWASGTDTLEHIRNKQTDIETDTQDLQTQVGTAGAGLTDLGGMSTTMKGQVQTEANDALVANHIDHLFTAAYDPASKPGHASGLFNVIVEDDSGVPRFTQNALEQAPSGAGVTVRSNWGDAAQDANNDLYWQAWILENGQPQTDPTACTAKLWKCDGDNTETEVNGAEETVSGAPSARGVYNGKFSSLDLSDFVGMTLYIHVTITLDSTAYKGIVPVKLPARIA